VILHEAGVPPIHTPVSTFKALPESVKERLYLVHIAENSVPEGLKLAKAGVHNSIEIEVEQHDFLDAYQLLETIESVDIFRSIVDARRSREALLCSQIEHFEPGQVICEQGSTGDKFYIIRKGIVSVFAKGAVKHLISGDFFGEQSLVHENTRRTATCLACCKVTLISFNRLDFLSLIRGSASTVKDILNLASMRKDKSWSVLAGNSIFGNMTSHQKQSLQGLLKKEFFNKGDKIWQAGKCAENALLLLSGSLLVTRKKRNGKDCEEYVDQVVTDPSTFLCDSHTMLRPDKHNEFITATSVTVEALSNCVIYTVSCKDLQWFLSTNPGPKLAMYNTLCIPALQSARGDEEDLSQTFISL
jgi:CRP-like cAMP-binding protein